MHLNTGNIIKAFCEESGIASVAEDGHRFNGSTMPRPWVAMPAEAELLPSEVSFQVL
jgi:hypothetical protein